MGTTAQARKRHVGTKYGMLTVIEYRKFTDVTVKCDCGVLFKSSLTNISHQKYGSTRSCGCYRRKIGGDRLRKHGMTGTVEHRTWSSMMDRCYGTRGDNKKNYQDRGIKVCKRWHKFENFYKDMGKRPSGTSIDRIDNNKSYNPKNCRWATARQQNRNKRSLRWFTYKGEKKILADWARDYGFDYSTLRKRIYESHWTFKQAIETPVRGKNV